MSTVLMANPAKKRRTTRGAKRRVTRRRYRRNPIGGSGLMKQLQDTAKTSAVQAGGALLAKFLYNKVPIPVNLKSGKFAPLIEMLFGFGVGVAAGQITKKREIGKQIAEGAMTIGIYNFGKALAPPALGLSGSLLGGDDGLLGLSYIDNDDGMGYISPAPVYSGEFDYIENESGFDDFT